MSFHDVRFPAAISLGSSGGVSRRTEVVQLMSGHEERSTAWAQSRRKYDAGLGIRSLDELDEVMAFFEARRGMLYAFRWKDWFDHKSCAPSEAPGPFDQALGEGDGIVTSYQLKKTYVPGPYAYDRLITKPDAASVTVAVGGSVLAAEDFIVGGLNGVITLSEAPGPGEAVTAGFLFDVPARFDTDVLEVNFSAFKAGSIPSIPIIEVRM